MDILKISPAEKFARAMRGLFHVTKDELDAELTKSAETEPPRRSGARKGAPNWRTKRKLASEKPTT
ncbi:MAG: hypothetical protein KGL39_48825 [Patescibacteria group bacterium]|nr:hypothetical protein [Patescibacteria group bacterium]